MELTRGAVAYGEEMFYGWPANCGIWRFGDELLVGFSEGRHHYNGPGRHAIDHDEPIRTVFARLGTDGAWRIERPALADPGDPAALPLHPGGLRPGAAGEGLCFASSAVSGDARSWFYVTSDGGRSWDGPWRVPDLGVRGLSMRTDYLVRDGGYLLGMTGVKPNGEEGIAFAARLDADGTWTRLGDIGGPLAEGEFRIMPALAVLPDGRLTALTRRAAEEREKNSRVECFVSEDEGRTWAYAGDVCAAPGDGSAGNPAAAAAAEDGTVWAVFCRRAEPRGVYLTSTRDALHWSAPVPLRTGAQNTDLGYPRLAIRNGRAYAVYYYNFGEEAPRFIECASLTLPKGEK
ncbi:MAG: exo-alpha-sialidase [Oscillospiraceae bacterium]|nr:exo-alpha-sialidase [Oscillospiraceae bacterium]